jgi:pimeloyl-ACP methyl ester carboxylesterase
MRTLQVPLTHGPVSVTVTGSGPAVLLVPGGAARCTDYFPHVNQLAAVATLIEHDRPGTGSNPAPARSLAEQAADLKAVIDAVGAGPVIGLGHSLGGPVLAQLALDHPTAVAGLVLLDPTPFCESKLVPRIVSSATLLARAFRLPGARPALDRLIRWTTERETNKLPSSTELTRAFEAIHETEQWDRLARLLTPFAADAALLTSRLEARPLSVPGLVSTAVRKPNAATTAAHHTMARLLGTDVRVWPGTTHIQHLQRPDRVRQAVLDLLPSLDRQP